MSEHILALKHQAHKHQTHNHTAHGWRIHCGVEVTEWSTNKQHSRYHDDCVRIAGHLLDHDDTPERAAVLQVDEEEASERSCVSVVSRSPPKRDCTS
jgi:hypothetical protein